MQLGVITGMHRSGTSLAASIVGRLGVDLGPSTHFLPARPDNERGYFENKNVTRLNDAFLRHNGAEWDSPPALQPGWELSFEFVEFRTTASQILASTFTGSRGAVKDPRLSLTLPMWQTVVDVDPVIVLVRHPSEVVASLERRDGMDPARAARLWLRYTVDAWSNAASPVIIHFDDLFGDIDAVVSALASAFEISPDLAAGFEHSEAVDGSLRHHKRPLTSAGSRSLLPSPSMTP